MDQKLRALLRKSHLPAAASQLKVADSLFEGCGGRVQGGSAALGPTYHKVGMLP